MKAKDMVRGKTYRTLESPRPYEVFEFGYVGGTDLMIVHPPGEPGMQSCWGLSPETEVEEVSDPARETDPDPDDLL